MSDSTARATVLRYTQKQGQYLAFIYYYTLVNRRAPAESDMGTPLFARYAAA